MINAKYLRIKYTVLESAFIPKKVFFLYISFEIINPIIWFFVIGNI